MAASAETARKNGRKGGRPKGSTTRPVLRSFYTEKELKEFIKALKERALVDPNVMKFAAEQIFGKAVQPIANDDDRPFVIQFDNALKVPRSSRKSSS